MFRFSIKAPFVATFVAPTDRRDHLHTIFLQVCTDPVLPVMIVYLNSFWIVGIHAKIRCHYILKFLQHRQVVVWCAPQPREPIIVNKKVYSLACTVLASCRCAERNELTCFPVELDRFQLRDVIRANALVYSFCQILVIALISVVHPVSFPTQKYPAV